MPKPVDLIVKNGTVVTSTATLRGRRRDRRDGTFVAIAARASSA